MNLGIMFDESCRRFQKRVAFVHNGKRTTYGELHRQVNALGNHLKGLGLAVGDKISLMLPNCPEFVIAYLAAQKIGCVAVTLNVMSTAYELLHFIENSDSKVFITVASSAKRFHEIEAKVPLCRHLILTDGSADSPFWKIVHGESDKLEPAAVDSPDPAVMIYTSGLTGKPVGAVLTHGNLLHQATLLATVGHGNETDCALAVIPYFHSFGASANLLAILKTGASVVLLERFTLETIFSTIEQEKITYICAVPRLFLGMIFYDKADNFKTDSIRMCITGGSAMQVDIFPLFEQKFHVKLQEGYGLTEASPISALTRLDMPQKYGSIGVPIPDVEARIVDDRGHELPWGEIGELIIRGPNVMQGYYKNSAATAQVIKDHWLYTSDLGRMDEEGYIFLTGRKKRMVITSGFNVYPKEVEMVLEMHPAVKACRIVSVPDLMRGEIVKALIVKSQNANADDRELLKHCRTYLSSYKIPREIEFVETIDD
jgi:long-chain acyl-CoA synthetase